MGVKGWGYRRQVCESVASRSPYTHHLPPPQKKKKKKKKRKQKHAEKQRLHDSVRLFPREAV